MAALNLHHVVDSEWAYLVGLLPVDLDKLAKDTGAIQRRRSVSSGEQLLRLALAYATGDWSVRQTAAMATTLGARRISDVAVLNRLRGCPEFLRSLVSKVLAERVQLNADVSLKVCLVDATCVSSPRHREIWRLHVSYDLASQQLSEVDVTTVAGGETLTRFQVNPDRLYVADRAYGTPPGLLHLLAAGARFVVRITPQQLPLLTPAGKSFNVIEWLQQLPAVGPGACEVRIAGSEASLQLVAIRKSPEATRRSVRRAQREAQRKRSQVRGDSLILAGYVLVLTNCAGFTPEQILEIYRFRWQIELAFKRLKSLLNLDQLRAHDPDLAQAYLLGKILAALLVEDLTRRALLFSPWGYRLPAPPS